MSSKARHHPLIQGNSGTDEKKSLRSLSLENVKAISRAVGLHSLHSEIHYLQMAKSLNGEP